MEANFTAKEVTALTLTTESGKKNKHSNENSINSLTFI